MASYSYSSFYDLTINEQIESNADYILNNDEQLELMLDEVMLELSEADKRNLIHALRNTLRGINTGVFEDRLKQLVSDKIYRTAEYRV